MVLAPQPTANLNTLITAKDPFSLKKGSFCSAVRVAEPQTPSGSGIRDLSMNGYAALRLSSPDDV
ncbi:hypothetical protein FHU35_16299 [Saccharopolyspora dendranthemae]|uniref:Uncharacterized protein n=1 Tax=Saccharopolyspora dendranthemae TaxID=1181886 RepID=A0A561U0Y6_9PSEU|nr:hypothetical protein FHU35_16299 [Saccharopolyspora dendranthemae]